MLVTFDADFKASWRALVVEGKELDTGGGEGKLSGQVAVSSAKLRVACDELVVHGRAASRARRAARCSEISWAISG
jgi:hypothetical protein